MVLDRHSGAALATPGLAESRNRKFDAALKHLLAAKTAKEPLPAGSEMDTVARFHLIALLNRASQHDLAGVLLEEFAREKQKMPMLVEAARINLLRLPWLPGEAPAADREAVELAGRAVLLASKGKHEEARRMAVTLVERFLQMANAHYTLGYVYRMAADDEAMAAEIPYSRQAVELAPEVFLTHQMLGRLPLDLGQVRESIAALEKAVQLAPECLLCHTVLANAYARAGRAASQTTPAGAYPPMPMRARAAQPMLKDS